MSRIPFVTEGVLDVASDINDSMLTVDGLLTSRIKDFVTSPPASPSNGDRYGISAGATGAFAGKDGMMGVYVADGDFWKIYDPVQVYWVDLLYVSNGYSWTPAEGRLENKGVVVQKKGQSTVDVMSQKSVTDEINTKADTTYTDSELFKKVDKVKGQSLFKDTERVKLAGVATGATKNRSDAEMDIIWDTKVDKISGKGLSDTNFTQVEKTKLGGVAIGATKNQTDAQLRDRTTHTGEQPILTVTGLQPALDSKVDKIVGKGLSDTNFTQVEKTKLGGVAIGATKNQTDAQLRARTSHTGFQPINTITDLQSELDSKVDKIKGQGLSDENFTLVEKNKLSGVAVSATKNSTDAQLRARTSHTGEQPIGTITGLQAALNTKVDKISGKGLSDTNFTAAEKAKLAGLVSSRYKGIFKSLAALIADVKTPSDGDYADVDEGVGEEVARYIWDSNDGQWVGQASKASPLTSSQVKELYEDNEDTNAYTNNEKSKLAAVAAGATKNATDSALRARSSHTGTQLISTVSGLQAGLDSKVDIVAGKALSDENYTLGEKNKLAGVAVGATKNSTDAVLKARASHTGVQSIATVSGLQAGLDSKVDKVAGRGLSNENYTLVEKTKLEGVATGATKNATDAQLRARASHTGTQAISTVTGLQTAIDSKVDKVSGKELSKNDFTDVLKARLDSLPSGVGGVIPIASGGTGAKTAAAARTALQLGNASTHNYGTAANTVAMGNDARMNNGQTAFGWGNHATAGYVLEADVLYEAYQAGSGINLTPSPSNIISVNYGTTANTVVQGNDSRVNNGQAAFNRLNIGATAATARTALQLGTAATKNEGYFALRAGTASQDFTTKEVSTVAANIRATTGSEGVKMEYNHTTKSLDFNFY